MARIRKAPQINFEYNYQRDTSFMQALRNEPKSELIKEAKRLSGLVKRRVVQIEKRGYKSSQVRLLKENVANIREKQDIYGTYQTVSKRMSEENLRDLIREYDRFLRNKTSTWSGLEKKLETLKKNVKEHLKEGATMPSMQRLSVIEDILENTSDLNKLKDLEIGSDQLFPLIVNATSTEDDFSSKIQEILNGTANIDTTNVRELEDFFDSYIG